LSKKEQKHFLPASAAHPPGEENGEAESCLEIRGIAW
jgi:hypothetical protein